MAAHPNPSNISPSKEASQVDFLRRQFRVSPPAVSAADVDLKGKTAIITGGNSGLGFYSATELLSLGLGRLIITARDEAKGKAAVDALFAKRPSGTSVEVWPLNLSDYGSITSFVERVKTLDRLDIIIQNAAAFAVEFRINPNTKHEDMFQVNYLSNALLSILLLLVLKAKKAKTPARVVLVNSETAAWGKFKERNSTPIFDAFDKKPSSFDFQDRYYTSKLLCQLFVVELTKRVPPSVAVITLVNPGFCWGSGLHHEVSGITSSILTGVKRVIGRSSVVGARTLTDAAVNHGEEVHGQYLGDCKLKPLAPLIYKPEGAKLAEKLWGETMAELAPFKASEVVAEVSS
ncbi:putative short-chain dehydrogenase/reductase family protein [Biscogniauxia marginata]|nr:putative short-chain dehydrogenase/reductase family protein [Biscogniauxia marginata]